MAGGAVLGTLAGIVSIMVVFFAANLDPIEHFDVAFWFSIVFGAPLGAVILPVFAWLLLRRVSFGTIILWSVAGAVPGAIAGFLAGARVFQDAEVVGGLAGAFAGFLVAAAMMRASATRAAKAGGPVRQTAL